MAIAEKPPINTESEKPDHLNLEEMYLQRKEMIQSGIPEAEIPVWEVYVRQKYRDSLDYIQRFSSDGEVQIIGTNNGKIEHSEYRAEDAFRFLDESVVTIEEPEQYRFYITDISLLTGEALKSPAQTDNLKQEFEKLKKDGKVSFGPPFDEDALWAKVHGTPKVIELGPGSDFESDRKAADMAAQDQAEAARKAGEVAEAAIKLGEIEAQEYARELAEIEKLRSAARITDEEAEVGVEKDIAQVRAGLAGSLNAKLEKDKKTNALAGIWSTNSNIQGYGEWTKPTALNMESKLEAEAEPVTMTIKDRLLANGFEMGAPEIPASEPIEIPQDRPWLGEQPPIEWPHIEPLIIEEGSGHNAPDSADEPASEPEVQLPEGVRIITYKTKSGKEQTRYKRADGKFVGKDGLTRKEREGNVVVAAKDTVGKAASNGNKNGHVVGNGNGNGKGHANLNDTEVIAQASPNAGEAKVETTASEVIFTPETRVEHKIFELPSKAFSVLVDQDDYRALSLMQRAQLEAVLRNLNSQSDVATIQDLIKNMFGIDLDIRAPRNTPAKA